MYCQLQKKIKEKKVHYAITFFLVCQCLLVFVDDSTSNNHNGKPSFDLQTLNQKMSCHLLSC